MVILCYTACTTLYIFALVLGIIVIIIQELGIPLTILHRKARLESDARDMLQQFEEFEREKEQRWELRTVPVVIWYNIIHPC